MLKALYASIRILFVGLNGRLTIINESSNLSHLWLLISSAWNRPDSSLSVRYRSVDISSAVPVAAISSLTSQRPTLERLNLSKSVRCAWLRNHYPMLSALSTRTVSFTFAGVRTVWRNFISARKHYIDRLNIEQSIPASSAVSRLAACPLRALNQSCCNPPLLVRIAVIKTKRRCQRTHVVLFYECLGCHTTLRPKPGFCCVFCSYGSVACPSVRVPSENVHDAVKTTSYVATYAGGETNTLLAVKRSGNVS